MFRTNLRADVPLRGVLLRGDGLAPVQGLDRRSAFGIVELVQVYLERETGEEDADQDTEVELGTCAHVNLHSVHRWNCYALLLAAF